MSSPELCYRDNGTVPYHFHGHHLAVLRGPEGVYDCKGSIPVSILSSLILMQLMGFSLNVITLSALVLGVGMMVDNSTVVLESCFRATDDTGFREFSKAALNGTGVVYQSVIGSTLTTCVVFLPLAMLGGMTA